ncbi:hypothetical protein NP233_g6182 [Leucocoprinus birnbaumii]|uniref:Uncharacterized protein n=1 Tax=Leucocoprinus birnbaumii TaxID=56174 RepID=A0AAD5VSQ6_9AGAR|nr:hypothetical protein NP233_g6182 [Leucocoprinus birnbaumii]
MRLTTTFFTLALALNVLATPIGDHAVFRRHTGIPARNARRYILQSRMDAPPACVAKASSASNTTDVPDLSNSTVTDPTVADVPSNSTSLDGTVDSTGNSTDTSLTDPTGNSTDTSTIDTTGNSTDASAIDTTGSDNSTASDTSNSTDSSSARRRRGIVSTASPVTSISQSATLDIVDLAFEWQNLCLLSGGGVFVDNSPCVHIAGSDGFSALLADADPCLQQTFADSIVTFAKSPGILNKDALIAFAIKYRRHPRTAVSILGTVPSSLYCLKAPINPELHGIVNAQPDGVNPGLFGSPNDPMVPFGSDGTCPFGTTADVSTCSCIPDSSNSTDVSSLSDGTSADNSTVTDSSPGSSDNSTVTDTSATSTDDSTLSDASATATATDASATDASATSSADDSSVTDAATSTDDATVTDSAVSDAAASTDAASATDSSASLTAVDGSPIATGSASDISGNINDPNGRRK